MQSEPHTRVRYFCSPHHSDSALHPIISQLERAAGLERDDTASGEVRKTRGAARADLAIDRTRSLLAELLSIPTGPLGPLLDLTPRRKKERTLEALLQQLELLARRTAGADRVRGRALDRPDLARAAGPYRLSEYGAYPYSS